MNEPDLFPTLRISEVTRQHMLDEIDRELKYRRWVYPRLVENRKLNSATADLQIKIMMAIRRVIEHQTDEGGTNDDKQETPNGT